ncbi:MAG: hypothetical protein V1647_02425 [Pseudomonadota bacterium]
MNIVVLKFGGKTLANLELVKVAAQRVQDCIKKGKKPVVVVSAMSDETDKLIELAAYIDGCVHKRELDHLLCTGEIKSAALFTMVLLGMGIQAKSLNYTTLGIKTNEEHFNAVVKEVDTSNLTKLIEKNIVPVIAGYQGINSYGEVTTLGRGGTDISAVAIAAALKADECVLFKDVGAVYYDDPKVNNKVKKFDKMTYSELEEIVGKGCKVVCKESVEFAKKTHLVILIANPANFEIGTIVSDSKR